MRRVESAEFRVEIRCVRFADTVLLQFSLWLSGRGMPRPYRVARF